MTEMGDAARSCCLSLRPASRRTRHALRPCTRKMEMEHEREMARIRLEERKLSFQEEKLHAEREVYGQDGRGDGQNEGESMPDINNMHFD